jgi:hypothetical protein
MYPKVAEDGLTAYSTSSHSMSWGYVIVINLHFLPLPYLFIWLQGQVAHPGMWKPSPAGSVLNLVHCEYTSIHFCPFI